MGCNSESTVKERFVQPCFEGWENEEVIDIREAVKKAREDGTSNPNNGANAFFCDTMHCIKEKDTIMGICGFPTHDEIVRNHLNELARDLTQCYKYIKEEYENIEKKKRFLEALTAKLGYTAINFDEEDGSVFLASSDGVEEMYPFEAQHPILKGKKKVDW